MMMRSALAGSLKFPAAASTGARLPPWICTPPATANSTYTAANANTAIAGLGAPSALSALNTGWQITYDINGNGTWAVPPGSYLYGVSTPAIGIPADYSGLTIDSCAVRDVFASGASGAVSGLTITNCVITQTGSAATKCVNLASNVTATISRCTIGGADKQAARADLAVDIDGSSTAVIQACDISNCRVAVNISAGTVQDCYMHDWGFLPGDHTDGVFVPVTRGPMIIQHNTGLMQTTQVAPVILSASASNGDPEVVNDVTIDSNLLAGGGYTTYSGGQKATRTVDLFASGGTYMVADTLAVATDELAYITDGGINIAPGSQILASGLVPGAGYNLSVPPLNTVPGASVTVHYASNVTVSNNRYSTMFYASVGFQGLPDHAFDISGYGNAWANNVIHDTNAVINYNS